MNTPTFKPPPLSIRRSDERGHVNHGWLDSRHTFSFADYYDPTHMGFRSLRVINDDRVAPKGGFPTHPHRGMEIFSYVLAGRLAHQDSPGSRRELNPGEIQWMRAEAGVAVEHQLAAGRGMRLHVMRGAAIQVGRYCTRRRGIARRTHTGRNPGWSGRPRSPSV